MRQRTTFQLKFGLNYRSRHRAVSVTFDPNEANAHNNRGRVLADLSALTKRSNSAARRTNYTGIRSHHSIRYLRLSRAIRHLAVSRQTCCSGLVVMRKLEEMMRCAAMLRKEAC